MPHLITMLTPAGRAIIKCINVDIDQFHRDIEVIVADVFNGKLEEELIPGENVRHRACIDSESMPKHFTLVVMAWQSINRYVMVEQLRTALEDEIRQYFTNHGVAMTHFQVFINLVGETPHT